MAKGENHDFAQIVTTNTLGYTESAVKIGMVAQSNGRSPMTTEVIEIQGEKPPKPVAPPPTAQTP